MHLENTAQDWVGKDCSEQVHKVRGAVWRQLAAAVLPSCHSQLEMHDT